LTSASQRTGPALVHMAIGRRPRTVLGDISGQQRTASPLAPLFAPDVLQAQKTLNDRSSCSWLTASSPCTSAAAAACTAATGRRRRRAHVEKLAELHGLHFMRRDGRAALVVLAGVEAVGVLADDRDRAAASFARPGRRPPRRRYPAALGPGGRCGVSAGVASARSRAESPGSSGDAYSQPWSALTRPSRGREVQSAIGIEPQPAPAAARARPRSPAETLRFVRARLSWSRR